MILSFFLNADCLEHFYAQKLQIKDSFKILYFDPGKFFTMTSITPSIELMKSMLSPFYYLFEQQLRSYKEVTQSMAVDHNAKNKII
ncbi:hypothetical protein BpHYR1_027179 [Brachionus plicatilis]|uniref:Uncharacterized protein n=1 Tax=Brachionus plicatilis TaxID=10195 RepID=A0A3M7QPL1_BRAPC|nr:hypothetical protein BpHYR1_027179 [Brachionus plicatilis]